MQQRYLNLVDHQSEMMRAVRKHATFLRKAVFLVYTSLLCSLISSIFIALQGELNIAPMLLNHDKVSKPLVLLKWRSVFFGSTSYLPVPHWR